MEIMDKQKKIIWAGCFFLALFIILAILWPGIYGPFIFDDYINLSRLKDVGCVDDFYSFLWFVFGGASANGRPLSFLTFLLHDTCWPTDPLPMKRFNLFWHALNFCLFVVLSKELIKKPGKNLYFAALALAFIWFIHPINVSSIFLTVQRMTLMMSTCVVVGLILYIKGRRRVSESDGRGYWVMWSGLFIAGFLGSFFKESAVLVVFLVVAIELTIFSGASKNRYPWVAFFSFCVFLPLIIIILYIVIDPSGLIERGWLKRDYSAQEKVLTELRILWMYARQIVFPSMTSFGIYQDTITVSTGLFTPITTFISGLALLASTLAAFVIRGRFPLVALGVLWFIGGHILEAFILPIELYFEHRNYLPGFGIILSLYGVWAAMEHKVRRLLVPLAVGMSLVFAFMSYSNSQVWGDNRLLSRTWYQEREGSLRASQRYIQQMLVEGNEQAASKAINSYMAENTDASISMKLSALAWNCPDDLAEQWFRYIEEAKSAYYTTSINQTIQILMRNEACDAITMPRIRLLIDSFIDNPNYNSSPQFLENLYLLYSYSYKNEGDLSGAMSFADKAYQARPEPLIPYTQSIWLYDAGLYDDALKYLDKAKETYEITKIIKIKGRPEFDVLEGAIRRSMESESDE